MMFRLPRLSSAPSSLPFALLLLMAMLASIAAPSSVAAQEDNPEATGDPAAETLTEAFGESTAASAPEVPEVATEAPAAAPATGTAILEVEGRDGNLPPAEAIEVLVDGRRVSSRPTMDQPWNLVLWLEHSLASPGAVRRGALALEDRAAALTALGEVRVVSADPIPRQLLPPSRDAAALGGVLSNAALSAGAENELRELRQGYYQRLAFLLGRPRSGETDESVLGVATEAIRQEEALVTRQRDHLLSWLAEHGGPRPALILVDDGHDLDPRDFYTQQLPEDLARRLRARLDSQLSARSVQLGRSLSALGWVVFPLAIEISELEAPAEGELERDRFDDATADATAPRSGIETWGYSVSLDRIRRRLQGDDDTIAPSGPLMLNPERVLDQLAVDTGGFVAQRPAQVDELIASLEGRLRLEIPASEGQPVSVQVLAEGSSLRSPLWVSADRPEALAAARARRLLAGNPLEGNLSVLASLRPLTTEAPTPADDSESNSQAEDPPVDERGDALLEARIDLSQAGLRDARQQPGGLTDEPADGPQDKTGTDGVLRGSRRGDSAAAGASDQPPRVRITWAAAGEGERPLGLFHGGTLIAERSDRWQWSEEVELPPGARRVAVVVEDVESGAWGGTLAAVVDAVLANDGALAGDGDSGASGEGLDDQTLRALTEAQFLPQRKLLRLVPPEGAVQRGRVTFSTLIPRAEVARVDFFLDGERVERRQSRPFEARINLGRFPRQRTVQAIAYDAAGRELDRDEIRINESGRGFKVRITEPKPGRHEAGALDVAVDVQLPPQGALERLELYWNDRRVATLYGPPYRYRISVPDTTGAFIQAIGHLRDGRSTEDVVYLNEEDFAEQVQIRLVELYTVVTDDDGRPVQGLEQEAFEISEEGDEQEIVDFENAGDLPITLGLTVDSSASMFVKLPAVQQAAGDFVRGFLSGRDRAFLVDFDTEPRLIRDLTSDLRRINDGIESLRAGGDTHLWESIVFSLLELQAVGGKKALVVFSDGAQEEEALSFDACYRYAQRVGVPVYLIVLHPGIARGDDLSSSTRSFTRKLERLTSSTGGDVFYIANTDPLPEIYQAITSELRSQYLITYYAPARGDDEWREVEVDLPDYRDYEARTIEGYFPRW
ncbi:MAG: VWA domain-containing protein [Acidobacteriota bacterium]